MKKSYCLKVLRFFGLYFYTYIYICAREVLESEKLFYFFTLFFI